MFSTSARRAPAFSPITQVYPPLPPMSGLSSLAFAARRGLANNKKMVPSLVAIGAAGYGAVAYKNAQVEYYHTKAAERQRIEVEKRRQDAVLMDAYGDKSSLEDLEKAIALYEAQRQRS